MINHTAAFEELDTNVSEPSQLLSLNQSAFPALRLEYKSLITSATMFAVGVLGNLIAIVVLCVSKKEQKETTFYTLVCGMAITDLLGTCFTSPVVIATYVSSRWPGGALLCHFFSFSMLFFGSAGMSILCAMAVERYLAINHAYFYSQHIDRTMARFALLVTYLANIVLCIMPSFGFGQHVSQIPGTWCFLDWRAMDPLGACYSFLYGGVMIMLIAVTVLCNLAVCRTLVGMNQRTGIVRTELCEQGCSRRRFPRLPSVTSAAEIQMFWLMILMTIVFLVCSIPLVVRIFVNQLYGPSYISAGMKPDYRSDLLAVRFASFNPILDPWVYILCRKNLLLKGCEKLKRTVNRVRDGGGDNIGWAEGQNSPQSLNSNDTSYASIRTSSYRNDRDHHGLIQNKSFTDFALRQAWEYDTARVSFHPFSVESTATLGCDDEVEGNSKQEAAKASPGRSVTPLLPAHIRRMDIVTCTFSTPSSCESAKCL
ncbi:prostaglandin E receptor 4 (subtype EP4) c [Maylandia zebra]|uniref:Prostaglandin E2 receptor EP4 subtype-like n=3 Tax=Haplochromini TaxID=319058 RepID=A0A3B4F126_9CICH|nr:prostaglandin E2 receptor EP4 subtype-like [Maylandia zebra]XP_005721580.1 PREDICTED: prostaglandin E2 receptor EP4 subtype-like [Pundamilia nyererei]XP_026005644.1 prostaglandin E2 receptor EP4 subtype-like [Astatotilapia calliptera]